MNPFYLGAAIRAVQRRRDPRAEQRRRKPLWWLVGWLVQDWVRQSLARPVIAVLAAVATTAGVAVALSELTPGPVLPHPDRWIAAGIVVGVATVASWLLPPRLRVPLWAATAGLVGLIEVGLHRATPGPVLRAPVRWLLAGVPAVAVVGVLQALDRNGGTRGAGGRNRR